MSSLPVQKFDAIIIGAGGAGMRASLQLSEAGLRVDGVGACVKHLWQVGGLYSGFAEL